mgnify:CR=1 FL=1
MAVTDGPFFRQRNSDYVTNHLCKRGVLQAKSNKPKSFRINQKCIRMYSVNVYIGSITKVLGRKCLYLSHSHKTELI